MSSPTQPITGPVGPADAGLETLAEDSAAFTSELAHDERTRVIRAGRGGPPQEVLDDILQADAILAQLARSGQAVTFAEDGHGGVTIELRDLEGMLLQTLSPLEAIELACGVATV